MKDQKVKFMENRREKEKGKGRREKEEGEGRIKVPFHLLSITKLGRYPR